MLDHAITIRDLLYVGALALTLLAGFLVFVLREFIKELFDVALHRYIWAGDTLITQDGDDPKTRKIYSNVEIEGVGAYAAVRVGIGAIRRDQIRKDADGNWLYRYRDW